MRIIGILMVLAIASGCAMVDMVDREPYARTTFTPDALVICRSPERMYGDLRLASGSNTVFEVTTGFYRGRFSTAHSSHDTLYLSLSGEPKKGERYTFSFQDGTLDYHGFGGLWAKRVHTNLPCRAEMQIIEVLPNRVNATVIAAVYFTRSKGRSGSTIYEPQLFVVDRELVFKRSKEDCRSARGRATCPDGAGGGSR